MVVAVLALASIAGAQTTEPPPKPPIPTVPTYPEIPELPSVPKPPETPSPEDLPEAVQPLAARMMVTARPRRDSAAPFRFRLDGWLMPPKPLSGMSNFFRKALGIDIPVCTGRALVTYRASGRTIARRRVAVQETCRFTSRITLRSRSRLGGAGSMRAIARFEGNDVLAPVEHTVPLRVR